MEIGENVFAVSLPSEEIYARLIAYANLNTSLSCRTTFAGSRTDPGERGHMDRLDVGNFTIGDFTGAVLNGIASELYELYKSAVESLGPNTAVKKLVGTGNGIRRNPLLARAIAEAFSLPLAEPPFAEEAALGAALSAGVGIGIFENYGALHGEVDRMNRRSVT
jgi:sedoheptulokinase